MFKKLFRKLITIADYIDIWFRSHYEVSVKQKALAIQQDFIPMSHLDDTIGKAIQCKRHDQ